MHHIYEPINGTKENRYNNQNHADNPASCIRRVNIEIAGTNAHITNKKNDAVNTIVKTPAPPNNALSTKIAMTENKTNKQHATTFANHDSQYSEREEVPAHSLYPRRQNARYAANILVYLTLSFFLTGTVLAGDFFTANFLIGAFLTDFLIAIYYSLGILRIIPQNYKKTKPPILAVLNIPNGRSSHLLISYVRRFLVQTPVFHPYIS